MFSKIILLFTAAALSAANSDWVVEQVRANNPEVRAAQLEADQAEAQALGVSSWQAPTLSYELMQAPDFDLGNYGASRLELSQSLPFPGRATLQGRVAEHAAMRKRAMARAVFEDQLFQARVAYGDLLEAAYVARALGESVEKLQELKRVSAGRGKLGSLDRMGQVMDAMIGMDSGNMQSMQPHWKQQRLKAESLLNRLTGADAARPIPDSELDPFTLVDSKAPSLAQLNAGVGMGNPELSESGHHIRHAEAMLSEAHGEWLPDLMFEAGLEESRAGMREGTLKAGISLPWLWFNRARGANAAAAKELEHAQAMQKAMLLKLKEEARVALGELENSKEELRLTLESALPAAQKAMKQAVSGYKNGGVEAEQARQSVMGYFTIQERAGNLISHVIESQAMLQRLMATASQNDTKEMSHE